MIFYKKVGILEQVKIIKIFKCEVFENNPDSSNVISYINYFEV